MVTLWRATILSHSHNQPWQEQGQVGPVGGDQHHGQAAEDHKGQRRFYHFVEPAIAYPSCQVEDRGAGWGHIAQPQVGAHNGGEVKRANPDLLHEGEEEGCRQEGTAEIVHEHADNDQEYIDHEQYDIFVFRDTHHHGDKALRHILHGVDAT